MARSRRLAAEYLAADFDRYNFGLRGCNELSDAASGASRGVTSCATGASRYRRSSEPEAPQLPLRAFLLSHGTGTRTAPVSVGPPGSLSDMACDWSGSLPPCFCGGVSGVSLLAWGFGPSQGWGFCISPERVVPSTERHALYTTRVRRLPPSDTQRPPPEGRRGR